MKHLSEEDLSSHLIDICGCCPIIHIPLSKRKEMLIEMILEAEGYGKENVNNEKEEH